MITASDAAGPDRDKLIAMEGQASETAIGTAALLSSQEVAAARMELARQTMVREMKHDWANFSLIQVKYLYSCKDIVEQPDQRLSYWVNEKSTLPDTPPAKPK
jgi:hypothetical protein